MHTRTSCLTDRTILAPTGHVDDYERRSALALSLAAAGLAAAADRRLPGAGGSEGSGAGLPGSPASPAWEPEDS